MKTDWTPDPWYAEQARKIEDAGIQAARLRQERRALFDPGRLYVVLYDSGVIKVGKSDAIESRLAAHSKAGLVRSSWSSPRHLGCSATERELIAFCSYVGTLYGGREYFTGIEFDHAITFASLVVGNSLRRAYLDELIDAAGGDLSVVWQDAHQRAFGEAVPS